MLCTYTDMHWCEPATYRCSNSQTSQLQMLDVTQFTLRHMKWKQFGRFSVKTLITGKHWAPPSRGDRTCKYSALPAATALGLIFPNDKQRLWLQTVYMGTQIKNRLCCNACLQARALSFISLSFTPQSRRGEKIRLNMWLKEMQMPFMTSQRVEELKVWAHIQK